MNLKELEKIELKSDVKNAERFHTLLSHVVNVPKEELDKREAAYQKERKAKKKKSR